MISQKNKKDKQNMKKLVRTAAFVALAAMAAACAGKAPKEQQQAQTQPQEEVVPFVEVYEAQKREVPQDATYSSSVQAFAINNIVPQTGARIKKINVEVGDFVSAGQILAEMDALNLNQAHLKLVNDSTELARLKGLYEEGGISKSDFEAVELAYNVSKSSYENLKENTILRSPISGVITARNYDKGDMYAMASPIYVVQQITPVKVLVGISETDYTKVKRGDVVDITADALPGRTFTGKVNRIYPTIDPATHTFTCEVLVSNSDRALRPGMYVKVKVTFAVNESIVIPDAAVMKQQGSGQRSVYIVQPDNTVSMSVVTLGRHFGTEYEILDGIAEGDKVVTKGQSALKNGAAVQF